MKLLLDSDVLLDVALHRAPFVEDSRVIIAWCQLSPRSAYVAGHTIANVHYLLRPRRGDAIARSFIGDVLQFADVAQSSTASVRRALGLPMSDFEDALQSAAAVAADVQFILTRDIGDYKGSPVPAISPSEFVRRFLSR